MPKWVVGTIDEIPPGQRKIVDVAGRTIGVFNVGGDFFALLNRCPHQGGPLCTGNTLGFLRSAGVGEFIYSRPGEVIRCPWHGWEFDLRTGSSWFDPRRVRVRRYPARLEAETYPARRAGAAVVVDRAARDEPGERLVLGPQRRERGERLLRAVDAQVDERERRVGDDEE